MVIASQKKVMATLQRELDAKNTGIILSVRLLNSDEIKILVKKNNPVLLKFYAIIERSVTEIQSSLPIKDEIANSVYIVLADDQIAAEKVARKIYLKMLSHIDEEFPEIYFKCSIGSIRFSSPNKLSASELIFLLKYGMDISKKGPYYCFEKDPVSVARIRQNNKKQTMLRFCLINKKTKFAYQPVVDRTSGQIQYYECLLRVIDGNNNLVSIGPLVSEAESNGLINMIDITALDMVIKELIADKDINLSVNISNVGVVNKELLGYATNMLEKHEVAKRLIIEITETSLNNNYVATKNFIDTLHKLGCRFALDDFGAGFTSFKQLQDLPIDIIKIDGSYIRDIINNKHSKAFVETLIKLAEDLGIKTVAEFVENGEIAKFLIDIKIDAMQGNFFLPASDRRID